MSLCCLLKNTVRAPLTLLINRRLKKYYLYFSHYLNYMKNDHEIVFLIDLFLAASDIGYITV